MRAIASRKRPNCVFADVLCVFLPNLRCSFRLQMTGPPTENSALGSVYGGDGDAIYTPTS